MISRCRSLALEMDQRVHRLLTLMKADRRRALTLDQMAESVNLSIPHLCYLFKTDAGIAPEHYFKLTRMEYSATLLASTFLSVKEVMLRAGFNDASHFVRDFKKIYGMTPTEYRKNVVSEPEAVATGPNGNGDNAPSGRGQGEGLAEKR